jgi:hypothetical protein
MKRHHRFTEFERHRSAVFIIYRDFDGVELAPSHRHVVQPVVNDVNGSTVFARNVAYPQKRGCGTADCAICCDVAVHVREIHFAIDAKCGVPLHVCFSVGYKCFAETHDTHRLPRQQYVVIGRRSFALNPDSARVFEEREFHENTG